jgi:hypothetical protein
MKAKVVLLACLVLAVACGGDSVTKRDQQDYDVVEEGAANGVTSTISGPGEVLPPVTNTNADNTTAFTLDPTATGAAPATPPMAPMTSGYIPPPVRMPAAPQPQPQPAPIAHRDHPEPTPEPAPATDTSVAPATDTATATATTSEPPKDEAPPKKKEDEGQEEPPPPPPTATDTRGQ